MRKFLKYSLYLLIHVDSDTGVYLSISIYVIPPVLLQASKSFRSLGRLPEF